MGTEAACAGGAAGLVPVQAQPKETGAKAQMGWGTSGDGRCRTE